MIKNQNKIIGIIPAAGIGEDLDQKLQNNISD